MCRFPLSRAGPLKGATYCGNIVSPSATHLGHIVQSGKRGPFHDVYGHHARDLRGPSAPPLELPRRPCHPDRDGAPERVPYQKKSEAAIAASCVSRQLQKRASCGFMDGHLVLGDFFVVERWVGLGTVPGCSAVSLAVCRSDKLRTASDAVGFVSPRVSCTGHDSQKPGNAKNKSQAKHLSSQG